ncbi:uncharacterized protein B0I36DRAFT_352925 [Microdochium trichocladiopsis]|uniref:Peptidase M43 pregnancy-associated plasma-A domain-containing protein n=1 Tax=Microdochium trichocladiopsis TaxID=1682393 RepID=A0A9P8XZ40_9PEZI|nr:uncharacterized protein B0I36DRAFT_352925 [Microdochium trichocladiopsis]KAH7024720.1 hypothetical protein B0I36DRAFT_352925 [Microdochium trichocladiopsis]
MRSVTVLSLLALSLGTVAQEASPSESPTTSIETVSTDVTTPSETTTPPESIPTPSDSSGSSSSDTPVVTPTQSDSLTTITTSSDGSTSTDSITASPTVSTDVDDPEATYTIPPDFYDVTNVDEGTLVDVKPSRDEAIDLGALEVDAYADVLADNKLTPQDNPDEVTAAVLPVCPNVKAAASRNAERGIRLPQYGCIRKTLEISVNWNLVMASSKTPSSSQAAALSRVQRNMEFLNQVYNPFGITFTMTNWETRVAKWFTNLQYVTGDSFDATWDETKQYQAYMQSTRLGSYKDLNVWVVDDITVINSDRRVAGFATFPNWNKKHDGIVLRQSALTPVSTSPLLTTSTDPDTCLEPGTVPLIRGSTLIHEVGHWLGLRHVHEGGCASDDGVADTNQVDDGPNRNCCFQVGCKTGKYRVINWMSYSRCAGTSIYGRPHNPSSFTDGQRSRMFSHYQRYRTGYMCDHVTVGRRGLNGDAHALSVQRRRAEDKAKVLADLLLHNCSVAIQDVFEPGTIPLEKGVLDMYSSSAIFLQANPTPVPDGVAKPETVSYGTNQPTATVPGGGGIGGTNGGGGGAGGSGTAATGTPKPTNGAAVLGPWIGGAQGVIGVALWSIAMGGLGFFLL